MPKDSLERLGIRAQLKREFDTADGRILTRDLAVALARLDVGFRVISEGRTLLDAPRVAGVADRIASLLGRRTAEELVPVDHSAGAISVRGFVQRPADARPAGGKVGADAAGVPDRDIRVRAGRSPCRFEEGIGDDIAERGFPVTEALAGSLRGSREKLAGRIQERYGIAKDEAERQIDDWLSRH